jgi:S1-C subfamily serine protease
MSNTQKRIIILSAGLMLVMICAVSAVVATYVARQIIGSGDEDNRVSAERPDDDGNLSERGLLIISLDPVGPAAQAGLRRGSIILAVDGTRVDQPQTLQRILQSHSPGDTLTLQVLDGDQLKELTVTLGRQRAYFGARVAGNAVFGTGPDESPRPQEIPLTPPAPDDFEPLPPDPVPGRPFELPLFNPVITEIIEGSPAEAVGLQVGDVITNLEGEAILTTQELVEAVGRNAPGDRVDLTVRRGSRTLTYSVTLVPHPDDPERGFLGVDLSANFVPGRGIPGSPTR